MINPVIHYSNTWLPSRRSKLRERTEVYGVLVRIRESESKLSMTFRVIALLPVGTFDLVSIFCEVFRRVHKTNFRKR